MALGPLFDMTDLWITSLRRAGRPSYAHSPPHTLSNCCVAEIFFVNLSPFPFQIHDLVGAVIVN